MYVPEIFTENCNSHAILNKLNEHAKLQFKGNEESLPLKRNALTKQEIEESEKKCSGTEWWKEYRARRKHKLQQF